MSLTKELVSARQEATRLEAQRDRWQSTAGLLEVRIRELNGKLADLEQQKAAANRAKIDSDVVEKKMRKLDERIKEQSLEHTHLEQLLVDEKRQHGHTRQLGEQAVAVWKQRLIAVEAERDGLSAQLDAATETVRSRDVAEAAMASQLKQADAELNRLKQHLKDVEALNRTLDASRERAETDLSALRRVVQLVEDRLSEKDHEIAASLKRLAAAEDESVLLQSQISALHADIAQLRGENETLANDLSAQAASTSEQQRLLMEAHAAKQRLELEVGGSTRHARHVQGEMEATRHAIADLQRDVELKAGTIEDLRNKQNMTAKALVAKEQSWFEQQILIRELSASKASLESRLLCLQGQVEVAKAQVSERDVELREAGNSKDTVSKEAKSFEDRVHDFQRRQTELEAKLKAVEAQWQEDATSWQQQRHNYEAMLDAEKSTGERLQLELVTLATAHKSLSTGHQAVHEECTDRAKEVERLKVALDERDVLVASLQTRLTDGDTAANAAAKTNSDLDAKLHAVEEAFAGSKQELAAVGQELEAAERRCSELEKTSKAAADRFHETTQAAAARLHEVLAGEGAAVASANQRACSAETAATWLQNKLSAAESQLQQLQRTGAETLHRLTSERDGAVAQAAEARQSHAAASKKLEAELQHERTRHATYKTGHQEVLAKFQRLKDQRRTEIIAFQEANKRLAASRNDLLTKFMQLKEMYTELDQEMRLVIDASVNKQQQRRQPTSNAALPKPPAKETAKSNADDDELVERLKRGQEARRTRASSVFQQGTLGDEEEAAALVCSAASSMLDPDDEPRPTLPLLAAAHRPPPAQPLATAVAPSSQNASGAPPSPPPAPAMARGALVSASNKPLETPQLASAIRSESRPRSDAKENVMAPRTPSCVPMCAPTPVGVPSHTGNDRKRSRSVTAATSDELGDVAPRRVADVSRAAL